MSEIGMFQQLRFFWLKWTLHLQLRIMRFSFRLLELGYFALLPLSVTFAQGVSHPPTRDTDGVYEVAASEIKKLPSSPSGEFPRELSAYELADSVTVALTITPEGKVKKAKAVSGKIESLEKAAEKTVKKWVFQPYLVNGTPVPIRAEIVVDFDNTFDRYRDPKGNVPVHLDEKTSRALIVKSVQPNYPPDALVARIQGRVELRVIVGEDGRVLALHIIKGHPMLAPAAYNAVRTWEFRPFVENGKVVPVDTQLNIDFKQ